MRNYEETKYIRDIEPLDVKKYLNGTCTGEYLENPKDHLEFTYATDSNNKYRFHIDLYSPMIGLFDIKENKYLKRYYMEQNDTEKFFYKKLNVLVSMIGRINKKNVENALKEQRVKMENNLKKFNVFNKVIAKYNPSKYTKTSSWCDFVENVTNKGDVIFTKENHNEFLLTFPTKVVTLDIILNNNNKLLRVKEL
ncbi:MAG: hypothetical protein MJZ34_08095 [Paludibacteraceae bacterium]|nr:hypothetical protein [Paludibacteraceae bacterium]